MNSTAQETECHEVHLPYSEVNYRIQTTFIYLFFLWEEKFESKKNPNITLFI